MDTNQMINTFKRMSSEKGFTLIELLVVMLILGILAGIAYAAFISQTEKADETAVRADLDLAYKSIKAESVFNDGDYPVGAAAVAAIDTEPSLTGGQATAATTAGGVTAVDTQYVLSSSTASVADLVQIVEGDNAIRLTVTNGEPTFADVDLTP